jgi:radical SAM protein with 4Fe4S-binding SPASM domain
MDQCSELPLQGYREFSEWLHRRIGNQHIPILGSIELTLRCNLRCQHCYIPFSQRSGTGDGELKLAKIKSILDEITDAGCLWLLLTGGDPLLRADFPEIYTYAKRKGLFLTLFTNGTLITPRIADLLAEWRPFNIEITLYGATQETYERVTGIPGSYARCMEGINLLIERKLPLALKTMLMRPNVHELDQMKRIAESLGLRFHYDPVLHAAIDGSARPTYLRLPPQQVVQIEKNDPDRNELWPKKIQEDLKITHKDRQLYLCGAGKTSFHIDPYGQLSMCLSNRHPSFDLQIGNFQEGWETFLPRVASKQYSDQFACADCFMRPICPQCPAHAETEFCDSEARGEYMCELTKIRYEAFTKSNLV